MRNGRQFLDHLAAKPREIWVLGERVEDVTTHPALAHPAAQIAKLYDLQCDPANPELSFEGPRGHAGTAFIRPASSIDLAKRREAFAAYARSTFGLMGRSPDFLNCSVMALAEAAEFFAQGRREFGDNIVRFYEEVRDKDLFLTHALTTPQGDRSKASSQQSDAFFHLGVVRETSAGIIVSGARTLTTLAPLADEVLIYNIPGLRPGDEKHALAFALPIDTPGITQIMREPYDTGKRHGPDHPLASRFEEADSLLVFKDVLVPWDRVFLLGDVGLSNRLYSETHIRNHTAHQTSVRGLIKMQFAIGLAVAVARSSKSDSFLHVQEMLGECVVYLETIRACIHAAEAEAKRTPSGVLMPALAPLQTTRLLMSRAYPRVIEILQIVGAGGIMMTPSMADFTSPIGADVVRFNGGADGASGFDRTRLLKVAWDLAGDAFGSRQVQYERYYAGDPVRAHAMTYGEYDWRACMGLVEKAMDLAKP